jgi:tetratricopeptide (TPR) repeat protein
LADDLVERLPVDGLLVQSQNARKRGASRAWRLVLLVLVLAAVIVAIAVWWRDRRLAEAERSLEEGGASRALDAAEAFLAAHPGNGRALSVKGRALVDLGRWDEASETFSQVNVQSREEMQAWATALVNRQRWSEAMPVLLRLLELDADDPLALRHLTVCRFQLGQIGAALDSAAQLAQVSGHEVQGIFLTGVIHRAQGNTDLAIKNWSRIEALQPQANGLPIRPAEFFLIYGEDLVSQGMPGTALTKLQKSQELEENLAILLVLGKAWAITGNDAQAVAAWSRAIEYDANDRDARHGIAELALGRSDAIDALRWLSPIASSPNVSSTTTYLMERAHTLLGNEDELVHWQRRTADLHQSEKRQAALKRQFRRGP